MQQLFHPQKKREDSPGLFIRPTGPWKWEPEDPVTLMKDAACAAANACKKVWNEVHSLSCFAHANLRWFDKHQRDLKNKDNKKKMTNDLDYGLNKCCHIDVYPFLLKKMIEKWNKVYKEKQVAQAWLTSWGKELITYVQANFFNPCMVISVAPTTL